MTPYAVGDGGRGSGADGGADMLRVMRGGGGSPTPTAFIDAHAPTHPSSRLVRALLAPVSPGGEVQ
eukprot:CAMPEP_0181355120 /NCGR_PEP_ID=MMETSP1106-20121128/3725_1 /TAXON_ID=81844 /ORGANISM="Mantoniella antarctica, Strain SL-175" /LENGTH=65 /DNA_ID=CAMNT_0023467829 /DNA_START=181 /DNA_END=379 /DNA_ORIENTATION=-